MLNKCLLVFAWCWVYSAWTVELCQHIHDTTAASLSTFVNIGAERVNSKLVTLVEHISQDLYISVCVLIAGTCKNFVEMLWLVDVVVSACVCVCVADSPQKSTECHSSLLLYQRTFSKHFHNFVDVCLLSEPISRSAAAVCVVVCSPLIMLTMKRCCYDVILVP